MANKFIPMELVQSLTEWRTEVDDDCYKVVTPDILPAGLSARWKDSLNYAMVLNSGSADISFYGVVGYREDGNRVDEDYYITAYNNSTGEYLGGGMLHHGKDNAGRTGFDLPEDLQNAVLASGVSLTYEVVKKPSEQSGKISTLETEGVINGFHLSATYPMRERED